LTLVIAVAVSALGQSTIALAGSKVSQGPESVFTQPVSSLFPELSGAARTQDSGKVGDELVYWGYKLADGSSVMLYACAIKDGIDCNERVNGICGTQATSGQSLRTTGRVTHYECKKSCQPELENSARTCCTRTIAPGPVQAGLVSCG
jgi:hypothetical protein